MARRRLQSYTNDLTPTAALHLALAPKTLYAYSTRPTPLGYNPLMVNIFETGGGHTAGFRVRADGVLEAKLPKGFTRFLLTNSDETGYIELVNATGAITMTSQVLDKGSQVYNVKAYGAVGDGTTDDTAAIQATISAASGGGEVFFPKGTYRVSTALTLTTGVSMRGVGNRKAVLQQASSTNNDLLQITGSDSGVTTLGFDGQQNSKQTGASLIRISGANNVSVQFCRLDNAKEYGLIAFNCVEPDISHNRVSNAAIHGILIGDTNGGGSGTSDFITHANRIYSCGTVADSSTGKGISILGSGNTTSKGSVTSNIIRACLGIGIELFANTGTGGAVSLVAVNDNVIERLTPTNLNMGISLGFCNFCTADGNVINGCYNGIEDAGGNGNSVNGNAINNAAQAGISVSGGTTNSSHVGNTITGTFLYGIHDNSSPTPNSGNIYTGNRITGSGGSVVARQLGIFFNNGIANARFTATGNQVTACSGSGIYLYTIDTGIVAQNICTGNVTNAANAGSDADIYFNLNAGQLNKIIVGPNIYGSFSPNQNATDAQASQTLVVGGFKKLATQTIGNTQTTIAHGLGYTPAKVLVMPRSNATFWESAVADGTNVYIQSSSTGQTADIYVA